MLASFTGVSVYLFEGSKDSRKTFYLIGYWEACSNILCFYRDDPEQRRRIAV